MSNRESFFLGLFVVRLKVRGKTFSKVFQGATLTNAANFRLTFFLSNNMRDPRGSFVGRAHLKRWKFKKARTSLPGRNLFLSATSNKSWKIDFAVGVWGYLGGNAEGPRLTQEPPHVVRFSNDTGTVLKCETSGEPTPTISWYRNDGSKVNKIIIYVIHMINNYFCNFYN